MKTFTTNQFAHRGKFALMIKATGALVRGGGVIAPRPRLYDTAAAASQAAYDYDGDDCEPVKLV